jgi:hypothetical protein
MAPVDPGFSDPDARVVTIKEHTATEPDSATGLYYTEAEYRVVTPVRCPECQLPMKIADHAEDDDPRCKRCRGESMQR